MLEVFMHPTAYRNMQCVVCEGWYSSDDIVATIGDAHCCLASALEHNGPGQFEAYRDSSDDPDLEDLGKALILYAMVEGDSADDQMANECWGYCGRFGMYLLYHDNSGFVTFDEYPNDAKASAVFDRLYDGGWGASEFDAYISCDRGRWYVSFDGKKLDVWANQHDTFFDNPITERRCIARVRLESMKTGYYPSLWIVSERGDLINRSY